MSDQKANFITQSETESYQSSLDLWNILLGDENPFIEQDEKFLKFDNQGLICDIFKHPQEKILIKSQIPDSTRQSPIVLQNIEAQMSTTQSHPRYPKNICGYILSKGMKQFCSRENRLQAVEFCNRDQELYKKLVKFCQKNKNKFNGIASIFPIFCAKSQEQLIEYSSFINYLQWFLRQKYIRFINNSNKIKNKQVYIELKNTLFPRQFSKLKAHYQQLQNSLINL